MKKALDFPKKVGVSLIRLYQIFLRPIFPSACRFCPTCSEYSLQAIQKYGLIKGTLLGMERISRCHGGNPGGIDELH